MPTFRHRSEVDHSPETVFRWHARPGALERLVPPWSGATVAERGGLEEGARVRLRVRRGPVSLDWVVEHVDVDEGSGFRDRQVSGPFRAWDHVHRFLPRDGGGCVLEDEVRWEPPLGAAARTFARPVVERELHRAFAFRHRRLASDLARGAAYRDAPLTVGVSGASGLVGTMLTHFLTAAGHRVVPLVRSRAAAEERNGIYWSAAAGEIDADRLEELDALVHLAGEPLFALRWTGSKKRAILESRRDGTRLIAEAIAGLDRPPRVLVSASGVHYYGDRGETVVTEEHGPGEGFLARVCREWERATEPAVRAGVRVVTMRSGVVLTPAGGALEQMLRPFRMGLGGRLGSGRQYLSWIDADDHVGLLHHALRRRDVSGPLNATAPHAVPNATFTDALGRVLRRPTLLPVPGPALGALLGDMGRELLLQGQRAVPEQALATGFRFGFPDVETSLRHQLGREPVPAPAHLA